MEKKQLPNGTWVDTLTPKENLDAIVIGFFDGDFLSPEYLRRVLKDTLDFAIANPNQFIWGFDDDDVVTFKKKDGTEIEDPRFLLPESFVFMYIADIIAYQLKDIEFAKEVYERAEAIANTEEDFLLLTESVLESIKNSNCSEQIQELPNSLD